MKPEYWLINRKREAKEWVHHDKIKSEVTGIESDHAFLSEPN
jgi:hypothetical protein